MSQLPGTGRRRGRRRGRTSAVALTALVTGAAVALLGWVGPSYATTGPAAVKPAAVKPAAVKPATAKQAAVKPAAATGPAAPRATAHTPAAQKPAGVKASAQKPVAKPAAPSAAEVKALRAKAAARASSSAGAKDTQGATCGGTLPLDTVHACASIPDGGSDTYTVTTSAADDVLTIQLTATGGGNLGGTVNGPDGAGYLCSLSPYGPTSCATGEAGTYTLVVAEEYGTAAYSLAVSSLRSSPCPELPSTGLDFGSAPVTGSLDAGAAASCHALGSGAASGDVLRLGGVSYEVPATVYDASGTAVCSASDSRAACTLSGTAPYRMLLVDSYAQAASYGVAVNRLSHPGGCAALPAAHFGDPGPAAASGTLAVDEAQCRTVTLPEGRVMVSVPGNGSNATWQLLTPQADVACSGIDGTTCADLPGAGTYTLLMVDNGWDPAAYTIALVPLAAADGCAPPVGTAYDLPVLHRTFDSPVQVDCQPFDATAGDRIDLTASTDAYGGLATSIVDPSGTPSCSTDSGDGGSQDGCVLTGSGPYRVLGYRVAGAYSLRIARLSDPAGCTPLAPQAYGTVPAASTDPCWLLQVPAAGTYDVGGTPVYQLDGTRFCRQGEDTCTFPAAGTYAMVFRPDHVDGTAFSPVFISPTQTAGCVAGAGTGFSGGPVRHDLTAAGARDCVTLPTASGNGLYLVGSPTEDGPEPIETVYDTKGSPQCENEYSFAVCKLTGTAPFHLVLTAPVPGVYGLTVQRTGDATGCAAWPRTPFGGSTGTPVQLTAARQTACLALPASSHTTAEMFDYTNSTNQANASVQVFDAAGDQLCSNGGSSATTCRYTAGVDYTAVLVGTGHADTYHLVRRDVSSTAVCATPASLTVGGPSTGYSFTSALDSRCLRVEAAATDKLWLSVRTPDAARNTGADLLVVDASGTIVCWQHGAACRVSGSTSYVAIVLASGYAGTPIAARVDTWRVGTASGWVPQCTANSLSPDGFGPRGGSLTESATAFCGVMQVKPRLTFDVYGTTDSPGAAPALGMYSSANWNGTSFDYAYQCGGYRPGFHYYCLVEDDAAATQVLFVVSPGSTPTPLAYTMQGVCSFQCSTQPKPADVTSVSPASGPAGTDDRLVVHGANLNLGTEVDLAHDGLKATDYSMSTPVSVSADGTALTILLNTRGVTPGRYDVVLDSNGYTPGTRSTGYLPDAFTVTASTGLFKHAAPVHLTHPPSVPVRLPH
ncbi:hypothetical protein V2S66_04835 [Streptomyces sp. V4-01]|uniref:IPT/TIG domain-containing protein n=1 Tax=Actinacidiphila polyblastidii TaxID=3110430 RepID=A0ABU7P654_9ACTN|nr:hypothetical protein [Streptomyces sp. V4-01]